MHLSPTNKVSRDALSAMVKLAEEIGESTAEFSPFGRDFLISLLRCWEQCLELPSSLCCTLRRRASCMILVPTESGWNGVTGTLWLVSSCSLSCMFSQRSRRQRTPISILRRWHPLQLVWPCSRATRSSFRLMVLHQSVMVLRSSCRGLDHLAQKDTFQHMWGFWFGPLAVAAAAAFVFKLFRASRAPSTAPFRFQLCPFFRMEFTSHSWSHS